MVGEKHPQNKFLVMVLRQEYSYVKQMTDVAREPSCRQVAERQDVVCESPPSAAVSTHEVYQRSTVDHNGRR